MPDVAAITMRDYAARNNEAWRTALRFVDGNGATVDLTGTQWAMHVRREPRGLLDLDISTSNGQLFLGDAVGTLAIEVPEVAVRAMSGTYFYDLKETVSDRIVQAGTITVTDGETREGDVYAPA